MKCVRSLAQLQCLRLVGQSTTRSAARYGTVPQSVSTFQSSVLYDAQLQVYSKSEDIPTTLC